MEFTINRYIHKMKINSFIQLHERLKNIKHVALDMDGTIYNGSTLFPFTISFLEKLDKLGIGYSFLTNNPSKSIADYLLHLEAMGIPVKRDEMYTTAVATIQYLQNNYPEIKRLFILGTPSMMDEFEAAGFELTADSADDKPDAVVVGFDKSLVYSRLCRAAWWISKQIPYLATNPDKVCPTDTPNILVDCGAICSCLEEATGRKPDMVIGKPDPRMLEGILQKHRFNPWEVAMVGDRIYTDIRMAYEARTLGVLVLSGESTLEDAEKSELKPDVIVDDLSKFGSMLEASRM